MSSNLLSLLAAVDWATVALDIAKIVVAALTVLA